MLHTYLFSTFPIIYFWSKNQFLLSFYSFIGICAVNIFLVFLINTLFRKSRYFLLFEACFSVFCLLLYYFIPIGRFIYYSLLQEDFSFIYPYLRQYKKTLVVFFVLLLILSLCVFIKKKKFRNIVNEFFTKFSICNYVVFFIGNFFGSNKFINLTETKETSIKHPNVYHILLDAYSNEFVLKNVFQYDNSLFYEFLIENKFNVFDASYTTYPATVASVSHMLNFGKLSLNGMEVGGLKNPTLNDSVIEENNKVWPLLKNNGYYLHGFCSTVPSLYKNIKGRSKLDSLSLFFVGLLRDTPLEAVSMSILGKSFFKQQSNLIIGDFNDLKSAAGVYGFYNQYFYLHVLCPHQPFLFDEQGELNSNPSTDGMFATAVHDRENRDKFIKGYTNNVKKVTQLTIDAINNILSQYDKDNKPIIILHGDHGYVSYMDPLSEIEMAVKNNSLTPNMHGHLGNLFAIYMPDAWRKDSKDLTFNNLYRFVFNHLFNTNYEYLSPRHFINTVEVPHELLIKRPVR